MCSERLLAMTSARAIITAQHLTLAYGENAVITRANFCINQGEFVCVVGANGSGKSTLIRAMLGLIKPRFGHIIYGDEVDQSTIGYLPQEAKIDQFFPATVREIVLSGALGRMGHRPFYSRSDRTDADRALSRLGLAKLAGRSFASLSGGQKQKVLLARALVATSKLLILDEPSNNLDHASRQEFYRILQDLHADGLTIIMITHDLDADDLIGDHVLSIMSGEVTKSATATYLKRYDK